LRIYVEDFSGNLAKEQIAEIFYTNTTEIKNIMIQVISLSQNKQEQILQSHVVCQELYMELR